MLLDSAVEGLGGLVIGLQVRSELAAGVGEENGGGDSRPGPTRSGEAGGGSTDN